MKRTLRLNLTAANWPMLSVNYALSTVLRAPDDTDQIVSNAYTGTQADTFIGIPTFLYMQNVMPTSHGIQSIGYKTLVKSTSADNFTSAMNLRSAAEKVVVFSPARGKNWTLKDGSLWNSQSESLPVQGQVTKSYTQGRTFVHYENQVTYEWSEITNSFTDAPLKGISSSRIRGIVGANNYTIAYDDTTIYTSSANDALEFSPSLQTNAQGESVISLRGRIVTVLPLHDGFVIYTTHNAVAGMYSGNALYPWTYREIPGASGVRNPEHVSHDSNYEAHWAWTTSGLQLVSKSDARNVFPEISDFLSQRYIEEYVGSSANLDSKDTAKEWSSNSQLETLYPIGSQNLKQTCLNAGFTIKVNFVGTRFVAISYGYHKLSYVLVYDTSLRRWGKLKVDHVDVFEWSDPNSGFAEPLRSFAFLQNNGAILAVDFDRCAASKDSVVILGHIKRERGRMSTLSSVEIAGKAKTCSILTSSDANTWRPELSALLTENREATAKWRTRTTGNSHCIKFTGEFYLSGLEIVLDTFGSAR